MRTSPCITVSHLAKQFRIGASLHETMIRDQIMGLLRGPFRRPKREHPSIWALRDISFTVDEGEVVGILGRNGAGKSTLLKILSRITCPTSGTMKVRGRTAALLEVGTGFHEELTGRENIYMNGSILGMTKREVETKLDAIVDFAGVDQFIDTPIKRYSSGMRLRLGFAVAAHLETEVLIIDEVLAVGDSGFQKKCLNAMSDLRRAGRTVLFVSHNMAAVENLCSRAIWIDDGRVREDGPSQSVIHSYLSSFTSSGPATDLLSTQRRAGSGEVRYTSLEILTLDRQPKSLIQSGDGLVLRFHYRAEKPVLYPSFGFRLYAELGTLVTDTSTNHHAIAIPEVSPGEGFLDLEISLLNLLPGRYYLSLWLTDPSGQRIYDVVEHGVVLDIELANVYQSGKSIDGRFGMVYFPQKWDLAGMSSAENARVPAMSAV